MSSCRKVNLQSWTGSVSRGLRPNQRRQQQCANGNNLIHGLLSDECQSLAEKQTQSKTSSVCMSAPTLCTISWLRAVLASLVI